MPNSWPEQCRPPTRVSDPSGSMMSTMANKLLALALGALLMSGCASQAPAPVDTTADQTALKEITATWFKSYNAGDADTAAGLYAEDAVLMPPHAPVARGRAAIRAFIAKDFADAEVRRSDARQRRRDGRCERRLGLELGLLHDSGPIGKVRG